MEKFKNKYNEIGVDIYTSLKTIKPKVLCFEKRARTNLCSDKKAQGILEYGLIIALVSLGVIGGIMVLKNSITTKLSAAAADITSKN